MLLHNRNHNIFGKPDIRRTEVALPGSTSCGAYQGKSEDHAMDGIGTLKLPDGIEAMLHGVIEELAAGSDVRNGIGARPHGGVVLFCGGGPGQLRETVARVAADADPAIVVMDIGEMASGRSRPISPHGERRMHAASAQHADFDSGADHVAALMSAASEHLPSGRGLEAGRSRDRPGEAIEPGMCLTGKYLPDRPGWHSRYGPPPGRSGSGRKAG